MKGDPTRVTQGDQLNAGGVTGRSPAVFEKIRPVLLSDVEPDLVGTVACGIVVSSELRLFVLGVFTGPAKGQSRMSMPMRFGAMNALIFRSRC